MALDLKLIHPSDVGGVAEWSALPSDPGYRAAVARRRGKVTCYDQADCKWLDLSRLPRRALRPQPRAALRFLLPRRPNTPPEPVVDAPGWYARWIAELQAAVARRLGSDD